MSAENGSKPASPIVRGLEQVTQLATNIINEFIDGSTIAALVVTLAPDGSCQAEFVCVGGLGAYAPEIVRAFATRLDTYAATMTKRED